MAENAKKPAIRFKGFTDTWEQYKLSDVADIVGGGTPSTIIKEYWGGDVDWYAPAEIGKQIFVKGSQKKITEMGLQKSSAKILPVGTVLFTSRAGIGNSAILAKKGATNQGFQSIIPQKDRLDSYFIYSRTHELKCYGETVGAGSTFVEVSGKQMAKMPILIPKMSEQKNIGQFFASIDNLITLHQCKFEKLQNVKKAMLEKMFPKNDSNVPEIRFARFTDAWEQHKLSDIVTMKARIGWQGLTQKEFLDEGDYYLITGTDFNNGTIDFSQCHYISKGRYDQDSNIQIRNDDVLITKDGTIGKVAYIKGLDKPGTLNAGVFVIRGRDKNISNLYLYHYLAAPFLLNYADKQATGGTIKHLNQNVLVGFPVPLPSVDEQQKIGEYFSRIDHLITLHQRKLEKLRNIKKACLEKMFV